MYNSRRATGFIFFQSIMTVFSAGTAFRNGSSLRRAFLGAFLLLSVGFWMSGCGVVGHVTELQPGWYQVVHLGKADSAAARLGRQRAYAQLNADTLLLTPYVAGAEQSPPSVRYVLKPDHRAVLLDRQLDVDVFTLPFKIRPPRSGIPVQLNSNFNAALYVGQRLNFISLRADRRTTPWQRNSFIKSTGIGYGAFVGLGSTTITPDVTRGHATLEYEGLVFDAGAAFIYDARAFNLGLAGGIDFLSGPDGEFWVYQRHPWIGLLFGLDLN